MDGSRSKLNLIWLNDIYVPIYNKVKVKQLAHRNS